MNFNEWRTFVENIVAGIFGGIIVLAWSLTYEILRDKSFVWKYIAPTIVTIIFFVLLILVLKFFLYEK